MKRLWYHGATFFSSPRNMTPNKRGIGPLVGRTSRHRRSVMHVLAVILSITYFFFICQNIFIRVIWSGREICPLLMYPNNCTVLFNFYTCTQWRIPEGPLPGGVTKSARSAAGGGGCPPLAGVVRGPPPGNFLKNGCKWCILSPFFVEFVSIFSPKIVCNFCLQSSDLRYTWCGRIFTLAVEDHIKPKRGIFYLLAVWGGLPEKIFEKRMQMVHS